MTKQQKYLADVRKQYEHYPFPDRTPEDEKHRLIPQQLCGIDQINHYCFAGKKDLRDGGRILVAGGGTGDAIIHFAEQLRGSTATLVYLDISEESTRIAKARAKVRGLDNIIWRNASLLALSELERAPFDYIDCRGVLHHLADPEEGLAALNAVLDKDGAIGLLLYAPYGRAALYQIQTLMRLINAGEDDLAQQVENCRVALDNLAPQHLFLAYNPQRKEHVKTLDNAELYDMFLHTQDRSYTIPELYGFLDSSRLKLLQLFAHLEPEGNRLYDPATYITDPVLREKVRARDLRTQQAIAELMHGRIPRHVCYVAKKERAVASPTDATLIPFLNSQLPDSLYAEMRQAVAARAAGEEISFSIPRMNQRIAFRKSPHADSFFAGMDGAASMGELCRRAIRERSLAEDAATHARLMEEFAALFDAFTQHDWLFLRAPSIPAFPRLQAMQARMAEQCMA